MDATHLAFLLIAVGLVAFLYSSVGHAERPRLHRGHDFFRDRRGNDSADREGTVGSEITDQTGDCVLIIAGAKLILTR